VTKADLKYARAADATGAGWNTPVGVDTSSNIVGQGTSLRVIAGYPAIAYYDASVGDLKFARPNPPPFTINWIALEP
jgi:hypothetical protein